MRISDWSSDVCSSDLLIKDVLDANRETQPPEEAAVSFGSKVQNRVDGYERWHRGNRLKAIVPHGADIASRSEEHTSELQSLMRISYAVLCLKKKTNTTTTAGHVPPRIMRAHNRRRQR